MYKLHHVILYFSNKICKLNFSKTQENTTQINTSIYIIKTLKIILKSHIKHVINKAQFNILKIAQAYIIIKITLARDLSKHSISFA
jgi:hypothetical protein